MILVISRIKHGNRRRHNTEMSADLVLRSEERPPMHQGTVSAYCADLESVDGVWITHCLYRRMD